MKHRIDILPAADQDLDEQAAYIAERNPEAGSRFLANAERGFRNLAEFPMLGHPRSSLDPKLRELRS